jgi:hypothetical protein
MGHFDPFPPPRLNGRFPFGLPTPPERGGKDAPKAAISTWPEMAALDRLRPPSKGNQATLSLIN